MIRLNLLAVIAAIVISMPWAPASAHDHTAHEANARATYLGNEGVLVARGETKILFDAFYADSYGQYTLVPDSTAKAMLSGEPPYDGIDAIFVSHVHGDHFTAEPAIAYLRAHPEVPLYGSRQTYDAIATVTGSDDPLLARIVVADLQPHDDALHFTVGDLVIDVVSLPHAGGPARAGVQNLSWRVTLDDATTVVHLGDADPNKPNFDMHGEHFRAKHANAAFPPYWFFDGGEGAAILRAYFDADQIIGIHVPAQAIGNGDAWRQRAKADLFTDPGEARLIEARLIEPRLIESGQIESRPIDALLQKDEAAHGTHD